MNPTLRFFILLAFCSTSAYAITIDDFATGPITLSSGTDHPATFTQSDLDSAHVVGGERHFVLAEFGNHDQLVTIDDASITLGFVDRDVPGLAYLKLTYGSDSEPLSLDLTADGNDRFVIDDIVGRRPTAWLRVRSDSGESVLSLRHLDDAPYLLFSEFSQGADFTNVSSIELDVFRSNGFTFGAIRTVPEPSSIVIAPMIFAAICITRRKRPLVN